MYKKKLAVIALLLALLITLTFLMNKLWPNASERVVSVSPVIYGNVEGIRITPTHFYQNEERDVRVVSDFANHRFLYTKFADNKNWKSSNMPSLKRPHALTYSPKAKKYFAVDTDNDQIISFNTFNNDSINNLQRYSKIEGIPVGKRPHDIIYNPKDKRIYVVLNSGLLRFEANQTGIANTDFISKKEIEEGINKNLTTPNFSIGYIRSISIVDGTIYLSNSTQGNIIRINDFATPKTWNVITNNNQPDKYAEKGNFEKDGLIINDIEYFNGYWYATNYYAGSISNYLSEASVSKNKLIRWATWEDFENSKWEDLSHLVHAESITYNFTRDENRLFLSMFHNGNKEGLGSGVYEIKTGYF